MPRSFLQSILSYFPQGLFIVTFAAFREGGHGFRSEESKDTTRDKGRDISRKEVIDQGFEGGGGGGGRRGVDQRSDELFVLGRLLCRAVGLSGEGLDLCGLGGRKFGREGGGAWVCGAEWRWDRGWINCRQTYMSPCTVRVARSFAVWRGGCSGEGKERVGVGEGWVQGKEGLTSHRRPGTDFPSKAASLTNDHTSQGTRIREKGAKKREEGKEGGRKGGRGGGSSEKFLAYLGNGGLDVHHDHEQLEKESPAAAMHVCVWCMCVWYEMGARNARVKPR